MRRTALLSLSGLLSLACQNEPLEVATVELSRMQGKWFEIASLPRPSQAGCFGTTADYELKSSTELLVINECYRDSPQGPIQRVAARAVAVDPAVPAKLSLDFGFAYGDFWIIDVGDHYEYAVVGHPAREHLWILARQPRLETATLEAVLDRARGRGFPVGILRYTDHE